MLTRLYVSNVVLIDALDIDFRRGLCVLTGETGAGKSILLDALSLALGAKGDASLIRPGAASAAVIAVFDDDTVLKRVITRDGKSKCSINDEPATQKALKELGDRLVEIHGQFANHSLLDEKTHIGYLDSFGGYDDLIRAATKAHKELSDAEKQLKDLRSLLDKSAEDREFLEHNVRELEALSPQSGEEQALADVRAKMMAAEKNAGILKEAAAAIDGGALAGRIFSAAHIL
ncbi:MAG: AAA family ATPase, partial [Rickettsiales bacterium]|nr:AAA family ATPase [Rickettsiales bacterium]